MIPGPAAPTSPGDLLEMYSLQPHPGCNQSKFMRVRPASCVSTSPPGDTLKTGNSRWRPFWAPMSFCTEVPNSDPFLRPSSAVPPPGPFHCVQPPRLEQPREHSPAFPAAHTAGSPRGSFFWYNFFPTSTVSQPFRH